jgi:hypothetical protein
MCELCSTPIDAGKLCAKCQRLIDELPEGDDEDP